MARISEFFGIVVSLFYTDHPPPHFHAVYGEFEAMIGIESIEILEGHLPRRVRSLVFEWAAEHQAALRENWSLARAKLPLRAIPPLE